MNIDDIIERVRKALDLLAEAVDIEAPHNHALAACEKELEDLESDLRGERLEGHSTFVTITDMAGNKTTVTC